MPHEKPTTPSAAEIVANVLAGKTADGTETLPLSIPFAKAPETRAAAANLLDAILSNINGSLKPDAVTPLAAKLLAHLSKTGLQSPEAIATLPAQTLADAIRENPAIVTGRAGIAAMLRGHHRRNSQAAAHLKRNLAKNVPPRSILWENGAYRLEEATDPRHLQQDSAVLKHCVGTNHNSNTLAKAGLKADEPDAIHHLHYWQKMKKGQTRILTLTNNDEPVATLEYDTRSRAILQISGYRNASLEQGNPAFAPLCQALSALAQSLPVTAIQQLPTPPAGSLLVASGHFVSATEDNLATALAGTVVLDKTSHASFLKAATEASLITVDVTNLPPKALNSIVTVAGSLRSTAKTCVMNQLQSIGGYADFGSLTSGSFDALHSIGGYAHFSSLTTGSFDALQSIGGSANFPSLATGSFDALHSIGGYADFSSLTTGSFDALHSIRGSAHFSSLTTGSFDALQSIGGSAHFSSLTSGSFKSLQTVSGSTAEARSLSQAVADKDPAR